MNTLKKETLTDLIICHKIWRKGKKPLKWWKDETGYVGINIRKVCNIPIPHPESALQIACIYYLHLIYISRTFKKDIVTQYKNEVYNFLKKYSAKYGIESKKDEIFPW